MEFSDKISFLHDVAEKNIINCADLLKFIQQNPLKKFVPSTTRFNGRPYSDYENEFTMHYHSLLREKGEEAKK